MRAAEIIVVDNAPRDEGTRELVRARFPEVRYVVEPVAGLDFARNRALREATGEVVAFLDDDAAAEPEWTDRLLAPYDDPRVVGVGGLVRPRWSTRRPVWFPPEFDWVVGCSYQGLPEQAAPVRNFIGANMSFRRTELLAVGGFLDSLGRVSDRPTAGCEETDLCLRITARRPRRCATGSPRPAPAGRTSGPAATARDGPRRWWRGTTAAGRR
jgi:glycosyltransferase involved in cell wall biosynthesis